jgi:hypothetical protein
MPELTGQTPESESGNNRGETRRGRAQGSAKPGRRSSVTPSTGQPGERLIPLPRQRLTGADGKVSLYSREWRVPFFAGGSVEADLRRPAVSNLCITRQVCG